MMFWLDAQLPPAVAVWVGSHFGVTVKHLSDVGLAEEDDEVIFQTATRFPNIVIVTNDGVFAERIRSAGPPPKVIRVCCGNMAIIQTQLYFRNRLGAALDALRNGTDSAEI